MNKISQDHFVLEKSKHRFILGLLIVVYVAALPYAIIIFRFLERHLTLPVVKVIPIALIAICGIVYLHQCQKHHKNYRTKEFIAPCILLLLSVFLLESNPIKYLHIPQFILLTYLIYLFLKKSNSKDNIFFASFIYACLFGLIDEIHHGIHPERYYGWKDMYINATGSAIGALFLNIIAERSVRAKRPTTSLLSKYRFQSMLVLVSSLCAFYCLFKLFSAAQQNSFPTSYPFLLFLITLIIIGLSLYQIICSFKLLPNYQRYELFIYWPMTILMTLHIIIVYAYINSVTFL